MKCIFRTTNCVSDSSMFKQDMKSFSHCERQGDVASLHLNHMARLGSDNENLSKLKSDKMKFGATPNMVERGSGLIWCCKTSETGWKTDFQKFSKEGLDQYIWSEVPAAPLHFPQTGIYVCANWTLDRCTRWTVLNWMHTKFNAV